MGVRPTSSTSEDLPIGGRWLISVVTTDENGYLVSGAPSVTITLPGGTTATPSFTEEAIGCYWLAYTVATSGRYVARVVTTDDATDFTAFVSGITTASNMPDLDAVKAYLSQNLSETSFTDSEVQGALDAEAAAQRRVCRVGAVYPPDLREALLRRVHRNLVMRQMMTGLPVGDSEAGGLMPGRDPEVRRLEGPHRKLVFG